MGVFFFVVVLSEMAWIVFFLVGHISSSVCVCFEEKIVCPLFDFFGCMIFVVG